MYELKTETAFDSAHFLTDYYGKCENLHGHRWRVVVYLRQEKLQTEGTMKDMVLDQLLDAFARVLTREELKKAVENEQPKKIVKDRFTVAEKIISIRNFAKERKRFEFEELFDNDMTKSELINTFLALLELLKLQTVKVIQSGIFGNIVITANEV